MKRSLLVGGSLLIATIALRRAAIGAKVALNQTWLQVISSPAYRMLLIVW